MAEITNIYTKIAGCNFYNVSDVKFENSAGLIKFVYFQKVIIVPFSSLLYMEKKQKKENGNGNGNGGSNEW